MPRKTYIIIGDWKISLKTGKVTHIPCNLQCNWFYKDPNDPHHYPILDTCGGIITIPKIVVDVSIACRKKK